MLASVCVCGGGCREGERGLMLQAFVGMCVAACVAALCAVDCVGVDVKQSSKQSSTPADETNYFFTLENRAARQQAADLLRPEGTCTRLLLPDMFMHTGSCALPAHLPVTLAYCNLIN